MVSFLLFVLVISVIVLFIRVSSANRRVDELVRKISQMDFLLNKIIYSQSSKNIEPMEESKYPQTNNVMPCKVNQENKNEEAPAPKKESSNPISSDPLTTITDNKQEELNTKPQEPVITEIVKRDNISKQTITVDKNPQSTNNISKKMQFTAAKIFSWIAAFAFILAVIFGLIYAVQNNIISKQMITAAAGLVGLILLGAGLMIKDEKTKTAAAALCASGITTFFIATYCSFSLYNMINLPVAFVLMAAISFVSFYISAKKDMQFISFLGMVAAFITPILLSNGNDNYIFFFTYIAFINGAAIAVSLKKGWNNLLATSLIFTLLCQLSWLLKDMNPDRTNIFQIIFTIYSSAITAVYIKLKNKLPLFIKYVFSAFIIIGIATIPVFMLLIEQSSPILINLLLLLTVSQAFVLVLYYSEPKIFKIPAYFASIVFLFSLLTWTTNVFATHPSGLLLLFIILSAIFVNSLIISAKTDEPFIAMANLIALFAILLMLINKNFKLENLLFVHNGAIIFNLCLAAIAYKFKNKLSAFLRTSFGFYIVASLLFSFLFAVQATTVREFVFIFINIFVVNAGLIILALKDKQSYQVPLKLAFIGILAILFYMCHLKDILVPVTFSLYLILGTVNLVIDLHYFTKENRAFPLILAGLVFLGILPSNYNYYIWAGLIFVNLVCLSLSKKYKFPALSLVAAFGTSFLFFNSSTTTYEALALSSIFCLVFYAYPFLCRKSFQESSITQWLASAFTAFFAWAAIMGLPILTTDLIKGLTTLAFAPLFLLAAFILYKQTLQGKYKIPFTIMSVMLVFFITAALVLIFTKQWLTLAFAMEGAALIFLNSKVPTKWVHKAGLCLLFIAFLRLSLFMNLCSQLNNQPIIFNWFLLVYSLAAAAMFISAKFWPVKEGTNNYMCRLLNITGAVLIFFLLNLEIANYFGTNGEPLEFNFFGNFAATITYTIAWTLYGAIACIIAFYKKYKILLNAGIVIMTLSIIKLFMFDLWSLGLVYRIVGLFAIAGILFGISYIFQKFKDRLK